MSQKIPSLAAGLTALGVSWYAHFGAAQGPSAPAPSAPVALAPADAPSPKLTVLLLLNGDILQGDISEDDRSYLIKVKLGEIRRRKRDVEAAFPTLQEAYKYKRERLAQGDPDEHMKLARWCIQHQLEPEGVIELKEVLALDSGNKQAASMLFLLEAQVARREEEKKDREIRKVANFPDETSVPREIDIGGAMIKAPRTPSSLPPVILDLAPQQAYRQYQEFVRFVHPQLQRTCIKCHSEQSQTPSAFQLIPAVTKRDLNNDALLRANLDAVMRLINPADLNRSELLVTTLMPHPTLNRPLFRGPNDPTYQVFATWVGRLKTTEAKEAKSDGAPPAFAPQGAPEPPPSEGFATSRGAAPRALPQLPPATPAGAAATPATAPSAIGHAPKRPANATGGDKADFRTVSPLLDPGADSKAKVGKLNPKVDSSGVPTAVVTGPDGKPKVVPLGPDGKPIPEAPTEPSKDRKSKTLKLDADALSGFLNRPR
jgi:hypothetical protein